MRSTLIALVVLTALVAGCDDPKPTPALPQPPATTAQAPVTPSAAPEAPASATATATTPAPPDPPQEHAGSKAAKEGEMCAGFAGIRCEPGLVCANVMPVADGSGTCRKGKK